jgi:hypothetical protein
VAVARDDLGRGRLGLEAQFFRDMLFDPRVDVGEGADRAGDSAGGDLIANSAWAWASLRPKVTGSAWMPWLRPMVGVSLCSSARRLSTASRASRSPRRMSAACLSCTASAVSSTSELVMPWWSQRRSGPSFSPAQVRKAMTSCLVTASMASIAATSMSPKTLASWALRMLAASSAGIMSIFPIASAANTSIAHQILKRFSADQMAVISGRE